MSDQPHHGFRRCGAIQFEVPNGVAFAARCNYIASPQSGGSLVSLLFLHTQLHVLRGEGAPKLSQLNASQPGGGLYQRCSPTSVYRYYRNTRRDIPGLADNYIGVFNAAVRVTNLSMAVGY